ncbi:oxygenase MpaB family protein [Pseudonocardia lacus]|uniref:oxygenase MpaB family protein n=1 Tax=Pseudonocardia lacus TaxID=2835865 RepID=UPI0027E307F1|nr:oxygenase MpaB family protein [Pseudonocardia lacus]
MEDNGLFGPDSVTWRVHLEPLMWVGGLRALLLQSLHPRVMRGTYQNSALFDPAKGWARFQRTVEFVSIRTFGTTAEVEDAAARVRRLHGSLRGHDPDTGRSFRLDEPEYLRWVHSTEVDSYAQVALRAGILDGAGADRYLAESVRAARVIGLDDAPTSRAEMAAYLQRMRPRLALTDEARMAVGNLFAPKGHAPALIKLAIPTVALVSLATLPRWGRRMYGLPGLPTTDLAATATLRALRTATDVLPDVPAPPGIERARRLVRSVDDVSEPRSVARIVGG